VDKVVKVYEDVTQDEDNRFRKIEPLPTVECPSCKSKYYRKARVEFLSSSRAFRLRIDICASRGRKLQHRIG
jgi:hypothetical protein